MRMISLAAALAAAVTAAPAFAQDAATAPVPATYGDQTDSGPTAPDGSRAFGIDPYVGVMGGWEQFDNERDHGIPRALNADGTRRYNYKPQGALVQGVAGINVPIGPVFVGVEGNVIKGVSGNIDWEYGGAGRFGVRAGDSGLLYGKVGYQWVNFDHFSGGLETNGGDTRRDYNAITYGIGVEVGPKDIGLGGITGRAGFRIRAEMDTFGEAHSLRPMLGVITHF